MNEQFDVFGLDTPCIDLNLNVQGLPELNHGEMVNDLSWQGGGKVSSGLAACARLGAKCAIGGMVGDDVYGSFCYGDFIRHGINTDNLVIRKGATTHFSVVISDRKSQTRTMLFKMGNAERLTEQEIDWEKIRSSKYLFIADASELTEKTVDFAKANGTKIFIDADMYSEELEKLIPKIDVFVGSEFVFDGIFPGHKEKGVEQLEEECREICRRGPQIAVFTFGEKGCVGYSEDGFFVLPAFQVDAVDTVGAGDVFHGAFLAQLLKGKSAKECARAASATSAIKCTRIGGRAGIPDEKTLEAFLETGKIDYTEIDERVAYYRRGLEHV